MNGIQNENETHNHAFAKRFRVRSIIVVTGLMVLFFAVLLRVQDIVSSSPNNEKEEELNRPDKQGHIIRGSIYDREGELLATSKRRFLIFSDPLMLSYHLEKASPEKHADIQEKLSKLAQIIGTTQKLLIERLQQKDVSESKANRNRYLPLLSYASADIKKRVHDLKIPAIHSRQMWKRSYPNGPLAAHILGFVHSNHQGGAGIEQSMNDVLTTPSSPGSPLGSNVFLTIDMPLQVAAEDILNEHIKQTKATAGTVIVSVAQTGELLSFALSPGFNPGKYTKSAPKHWNNHALSDVYEPGSIFKTFFTAILLEEKKADLLTKTTCTGSTYLGSHRISCHHNSELVKTFSDILPVSCNVGMINFSRKIDDKIIKEYLKRFGFGLKTGISLPYESRGIIPPIEKWTPITGSSMSIGYGISVTPIQIVSAVGALANGGALIRPRIVHYEGDKKTQAPFKPHFRYPHRVISEDTSQKVMTLLQEVVSSGTAHSAQINFPSGTNMTLPAAGKTGTSRVWSTKKKSYEGGLNATYIGLVPTIHGNIVILIVIKLPQRQDNKQEWASRLALPVYRQLVHRMIDLGYIINPYSTT